MGNLEYRCRAVIAVTWAILPTPSRSGPTSRSTGPLGGGEVFDARPVLKGSRARGDIYGRILLCRARRKTGNARSGPARIGLPADRQTGATGNALLFLSLSGTDVCGLPAGSVASPQMAATYGGTT